MQIIEQFLKGKSPDESLNEDKIITTDDFIGVIDGATSRDGFKLGGMSNGRFAAEVLADGVSRMPADITAKEMVLFLTLELREKAHAAAAKDGRVFTDIWSYPAAALLLYSKKRREIWRIADSTFVQDGVANYKIFPQEAVWSSMRNVLFHAKMKRGATEADFIENDPTWDLMTKLITECKIFANNTGPYSYGVFNCADIPDEHIEVYPVGDTKEIAFASDGYPEVFMTLDQTEKRLAAILKEDPLMYKIHPQVKGVKAGTSSYDDRSYIRFRI